MVFDIRAYASNTGPSRNAILESYLFCRKSPETLAEVSKPLCFHALVRGQASELRAQSYTQSWIIMVKALIRHVLISLASRGLLPVALVQLRTSDLFKCSKSISPLNRQSR